MAKVPCPICGPTHDIRRLYDDTEVFRAKLESFARRHPENEFASTMFEIVNRIHRSLATTLRQRVAAQRVTRGRCICKGTRTLDDSNISWEGIPPRG